MKLSIKYFRQHQLTVASAPTVSFAVVIQPQTWRRADPFSASWLKVRQFALQQHTKFYPPSPDQ